MLSILGFLIVLGPLVIVHEFGHYFFARIFGVRADVFSIGFGPKLWSKQLGETELRISAIPLGGYVKLFGEEPDVQLSPEDQKRALQKQVPWKRFFIFFGGPLFNFLFAILVFMAILVIGEDHVASVVGRVVYHSYAEKIGFQSGDKILSINEKPVHRYEEVAQVIHENPERDLRFLVIHPGSTSSVVLHAKPSLQQGFSLYGEWTSVGEIAGLFPAARSTQIGVSNPTSSAARGGFKTGDKILAFNAMPISNWEALEQLYSTWSSGTSFQLRMENKEQHQKEIPLTKPLKSISLGSDLGLYSSELFIDKTMPSSPAELAGIRQGDRIVSIENQKIKSFFELKDAVQKNGEKTGKVTIHWERSGKSMSATILPTSTEVRDPILKKTTQYTVGIVPMLSLAAPMTIKERVLNPIMLLHQGTERMVVFSWRNLVSLKKIITGDVSVATLGGPILIGKIAGESLSRGLIAILTTMAILSVGLGVLNVLPVPVLDGGHLMLLGLEIIRGKPLTIRQMEIVQQVGLSLILLLMIIVIRNDLARLQ